MLSIKLFLNFLCYCNLYLHKTSATTVSSQFGMLTHVHTSRRPRVISALARLSPPPLPPPHPTLRDNHPSDRYKARAVLVRTLFAKGHVHP